MHYLALLSLIVFTAGSLTACHPAHYGHPHGCPPGQAKKGNCYY